MSDAAQRAKTLRAELAKVEKQAKAERDAERAARRQREREEAEASAEAYREENYEVTAGGHKSYATANTGFGDSVEIGIAEWSSHQTSAVLSRAEARAFAEGILKLLK